MILIFGQGNPGIEYENTKHNISWSILDFFAESNSISFQEKSKFFAYTAEINTQNDKILLIKPTTFYNDTGKSLREIKDFYKIPNEKIIVIHDDLSIDFGKIRVRHKGSDAGNNGIKSLNSAIGQDFIRIKVGILNEKRKLMNDSNFVLSKFNQNEKTVIKNQIYPIISEILSNYIENKNLEDKSFSI